MQKLGIKQTRIPQLQLVPLSSTHCRNAEIILLYHQESAPCESSVPGFVKKKKKKKVYSAHKRVSYEAAVETSAARNVVSSVASGADVNVLEYHSTFGSGVFEFHASLP